MPGVPEIYTVLEWYTVDERAGRCWFLQNRRDNPDPDGPAYFDFPGLSTPGTRATACGPARRTTGT